MNQDTSLDKESVNGHLCVFYEDEIELLEFVIYYFEQGIKNKELCLLVTSRDIQSITKIFQEYSSVLKKAFDMKNLVILDTDTGYLPTGNFSATDMLKQISDMTHNAESRGLNGLRIAGDMGWLHNHPNSLEAVIDCESRINDFYFEDNNTVVTCMYPVADSSGEISHTALKTHPYVMRKDQLIRNYIYSL